MENLSVSDPPQPGGAPALGRAPQQQPQLPAQMFTTAAQLLDLTDKKLMVVLRDGRKVTGVLRSWDQFANLVLQSSVERIFVPPGSAPIIGAGDGAESRGLYADVPRGTFLVRGENVLLLGEIDLDRDDDPPAGYNKADAELVMSLARKRRTNEKGREKAKLRKLAGLGFEGENVGETLL